MKRIAIGLTGISAVGAALAAGAVATAQDPPKPQSPAWAYAVPLPDNPPPMPAPAATDVFTLPGTGKSFTVAHIRGQDLNADPPGPADWYPGDHPPMPKLVRQSDPPRIAMACSLCHYPNGKGRAENAAVSGLSHDYFVATMKDYRSGARTSAEPAKANTKLMIAIAKAMTDAEIEETAAYFGAIPWTQWIKVVESATAPKVRSNAGLYQPVVGPAAGTEPLGRRIVEIPVDVQATEVLRDPRSGFIAYVPIGAVARGKAVVMDGNERTLACTACHGADLQGVGAVPAIASRSPSYMARQLNDYRQGARNGPAAELMKPVVERMTEDDIIDVTAYLASIPVPAGAR